MFEAQPAARRLRVKLEGGDVIAYDPGRLSGVTVARLEQRVVAKGDQVEFRAADRDLGVANGQLAEVVGVDAKRRQARLRLEGRDRFVVLDLGRAQALDHGYASTSSRSQGRTVGHVIDLQDARWSTREGLYVGTSRGRDTILVVTGDRVELLDHLRRDSATRPQAIAVDRVDRPI